MKGIEVLLSAMLIGSIATRAHAQTSTDTDDAARRYHVTVSASPLTSAMQITPVGGHEPVAECVNQCEFQALPGRYLLDAQDRESGEHQRMGFRVRRPTSFVFEEGDDTARGLGAGIGVLGSLSVIVGLGLIIGNSSTGDSAPPQTPAQHRALEVGVGMLLGGIVATPTGWIIFGQNRARLTQGDDPNSASRGLRLGLVSVNGGVALGGLVLF